MSLGQFGKLLLQLSELSRDEKSIIFIQLAKDLGFCIEDGKRVSAAATPADRKPYSQEEQAEFEHFAARWPHLDKGRRSRILDDLAKHCGRDRKAIAWQITSRVKK